MSDEVQVAEVTPQPATVVLPVKRGRGRPRKVVVETNTASEVVNP